MEAKKTVYIDYDGTLAFFNKEKSLEEVAAPGYTLTVPMIPNICEAIGKLLNDRELDEFDFRLLSCIINDGAKDDKKKMLVATFGQEFAEKAVFVNYGDSKAPYAKGNILLDDFSKNLREWESNGGIGFKVYNDINGTHGTWKGYSVNAFSKPDIIYSTLKGVLLQLAA